MENAHTGVIVPRLTLECFLKCFSLIHHD